MFNQKSIWALLSVAAIGVASVFVALLSSHAQVSVGAGALVKGSQSTVYYLADDGGRYYFPNSKIFFTWYDNFDGVQVISDDQLATYPLKGNVSYRAGRRLIKIESDPKVYAVDTGAFLRWVPSEASAMNRFGSNWAKNVDDIPVSFFSDYVIGTPLEEPGVNYDATSASNATPTVNDDLQERRIRRGQNTSRDSNTNENDGFSFGDGGESGGSSSNQSNTPSPNPTPTATCGNGIREGSEQCDGSDLNAESCTTRSFVSGTLSCSSSCTYVTSACSNAAPESPAPGPDTTAPSVSWTSPSSNATVSGSITLTATATDAVGVSSVKFQINNTLITTDTSSPYTTSYSTTGIANGSYTLYAVAKDAAGNYATSTRGITVSNVVADTTVPTVSWTSPSAGATISGSVTLTATASDNVAVASVKFQIGNTLIVTDTSSPYTTGYNTTAVSNGSYTFYAVARDTSGNYATSTRSVTVSNGEVQASVSCVTNRVGPSNGTTYYVCDCQAGSDPSCVAGNDSNNGTSPATAWKTYEKAMSFFNGSMQAGDTVAFCRGGVFEPVNVAGQFINSRCRKDSPCTIGAYTPSWTTDSGPRPRIMIGASTGNAIGFQFSDNGVPNHEEGYVVQSIELVGTSVEPGNRHWGVFISNDTDDVVFDDLIIRGFDLGVHISSANSGGDPSETDGRNDRIALCRSQILDNVGQGWLGSCSDCLIENNTFDNNGFGRPGSILNRNHNIYWSGAQVTSNSIIRNNQLFRSAVNVSTGKCEGAPLVSHGVHTNLLVEGNLIREGVGRAIGGCWGIAFDGTSETNHGWDGLVIRGNWIENVGNTMIGCHGCKNGIIENNVLIQQQNEFNTTGIEIPNKSDIITTPTKNMTVRNNTIYIDSSYRGLVGIAFSDNDGNSEPGPRPHTFLNNLIYFAGTAEAKRCFDLQGDFSAITMDYNLCYGTNEWLPWTTLAAWQSQSGQSNHSLTSDPLLMSIPTDFRPTSSSPAKNAGHPTNSASTDFGGNIRDSASDIGAYEYIP